MDWVLVVVLGLSIWCVVAVRGAARKLDAMSDRLVEIERVSVMIGKDPNVAGMAALADAKRLSAELAAMKDSV